MYKIVTILFLLLSTITYSQSSNIYFELDVPDYVQPKTKFGISAVTNFNKFDADKCEIYLYTENNISIHKANFISRSNNAELELIKGNESEYLDNVFSFSLDLNDIVFQSQYPSQIIYEAEASYYMTSEISIRIIFYKADEPIYIVSSIDDFDTDQLIDPVYAVFYEPSYIEDTYLKLDANTALEVSLPNQLLNDNLVIELWTKVFNSESLIMDLINEMQNRISLEMNRFDMLTLVTEDFYNLYEDFYVSHNSWNHIVINYSKKNKLLDIYCNERKLFSIQIDLLSNYSKIRLGGKSSIAIENFRVWDFGNNLDLVHANKNYSYFNADSSNLLLSYKFNNQEEFSLFNVETGSKINNYKFEKSDVPIYSRAPVLDAKLNNNFYLFEWSNKEVANVSKFVLERSVDGASFNNIYSVEGSGQKDQVYSYADSRELYSELLYYRIKQVNSDSSVVYSNQIKIGQGEKEIFNLEQNYPNPFNPMTKINVEMFEATEVKITVFNVVGNKIEELHEGILNQGKHEFTFDGSNLTSGIYFIEVKTDKATRAKKMILAK